jgi:hypothetical protein
MRVLAGRTRDFGAAVLTAWLAFGCGKSDGNDNAAWPKRATLKSAEFGGLSPGLRLADGEQRAADGDLALFLGVQLSLRSVVDDADDIFCEQGSFDSLEEVPSVADVCPGSTNGARSSRLFLSAAIEHSNAGPEIVGLSTLVRDSEGESTYRLRVRDDSVALNADGSLGNATATFEYEPVD